MIIKYTWKVETNDTLLKVMRQSNIGSSCLVHVNLHNLIKVNMGWPPLSCDQTGGHMTAVFY